MLALENNTITLIENVRVFYEEFTVKTRVQINKVATLVQNLQSAIIIFKDKMKMMISQRLPTEKWRAVLWLYRVGMQSRIRVWTAESEIWEKTWEFIFHYTFKITPAIKKKKKKKR